MNQRNRPNERRAEDIVAVVTGGHVDRMDVPGAPNKTHDFNVRLPDARTVAIEVTRHTFDKRISLLREIQKRSTGQRSNDPAASTLPWILPGLADSWHLTLSINPPASVKALHAQAAALLNAATLVAPDRFRPSQDSDLYRLGVRVVIKLPDVQPPQVFCAIEEGDFDPVTLESPRGDLVAQAIEHNVRENREKLERAQADERHLFLWLEFSERATLADLGAGGHVRRPVHGHESAPWRPAVMPGRRTDRVPAGGHQVQVDGQAECGRSFCQ